MPAGLPKIDIQFILNADGILTVRARELRSGLEQQIEIRPLTASAKRTWGVCCSTASLTYKATMPCEACWKPATKPTTSCSRATNSFGKTGDFYAAGAGATNALLSNCVRQQEGDKEDHSCTRHRETERLPTPLARALRCEHPRRHARKENCLIILFYKQLKNKYLRYEIPFPAFPLVLRNFVVLQHRSESPKPFAHPSGIRQAGIKNWLNSAREKR